MSTATTTKHREGCRRVFSRRDPECPRCVELENGAPPRAGWSDTKRRHEEEFRRALRAHNCEAAKCGPVCTFGDW